MLQIPRFFPRGVYLASSEVQKRSNAPVQGQNWRQKSANPALFPRMSPGSTPGMAADKCINREIKFDVTWSYVTRQMAKMTSEFVFFSSNPSLNHIKLEKCLLLFATNTTICTLLFKEIKTDGKSFIFAVCWLTYDHVTSNLISLIKTNKRIRIFHNYWSLTLSTILTIQLLVVFLIFVRWPTTVTAKELTSRQKEKPQ